MFFPTFVVMIAMIGNVEGLIFPGASMLLPMLLERGNFNIARSLEVYASKKMFSLVREKVVDKPFDKALRIVVDEVISYIAINGKAAILKNLTLRSAVYPLIAVILYFNIKTVIAAMSRRKIFSGYKFRTKTGKAIARKFPIVFHEIKTDSDDGKISTGATTLKEVFEAEQEEEKAAAKKIIKGAMKEIGADVVLIMETGISELAREASVEAVKIASVVATAVASVVVKEANHISSVVKNEASHLSSNRKQVVKNEVKDEVDVVTGSIVGDVKSSSLFKKQKEQKENINSNDGTIVSPMMSFGIGKVAVDVKKEDFKTMDTAVAMLVVLAVSSPVVQFIYTNFAHFTSS